MKISSVLSALSSGALLYLVMAACSATTDTHAPAASSSADEGGASSGSVVDGMVGAVTNPVPTATAAPGDTGPTVAVEQCDKTYVQNGITYRYAEHAYAGASVSDLALVRAYYGIANNIPGYTDAVTITFLKTGSVAVSCVQGATVTFVKP